VGVAQHLEGHQGPSKKRAGDLLRHSLFSLKRIAKFPCEDRQKVMNILKKNARKRRRRGVGIRSSVDVPQASSEVATTSSSVNDDWKHWVVLQGNNGVANEDVLDVGKLVGATFTCDSCNMFSVLSKTGAGKPASGCPSQGGADAAKDGT
jgi:hypothetical protein